jgi:hypothetical protein
VEKNKMCTSNLTLIFTPAIFQDLNHAQNSPGEWAKDCVLEDLIVNSQDIFANKDLHNNSAITGHIEYGFDHTPAAHDQPSRYAMTVQSPDSPTGTCHEEDESGYSFITIDDDYVTSVHDDCSASSNSALFLSADMSEPQHQHLQRTSSRPTSPQPQRTSSRSSSPQPQRTSSRSPSPQPPKEVVETTAETTAETEEEITPPSRSGSFERKKYQARFQGKGLTVNTGAMSSSGGKGNGIDVHVPTVKSAIEPSRDWLNIDPANTPILPKPRRSATTGKKLASRRKNSARHTPEDGDIPSVPVMTRYHSATTTTTTTIAPHNI